ncbi:hypothetical protein LSCM1_00038 [Leishmania martiniquensis]|uniref:Uncharacterized protein n=1 Tax=Leishmania martiniquensis TaxID=1580590 RepID=A0A836KAM9_9TRYP|nr:hypothetical protein LSCM1_00038 [Leishmania martiniquensis]
MDFEALLSRGALSPLMSEFALHLIDRSDTASLMARLPPRRIALLYHAALLRRPVTAPTKGECLYETERLCASVLDAYGLCNGDVEEGTPGGHVARMRPAGSGIANDGAAAMGMCPALCRRLAEVEMTHPLLEEALAARESRLQHHIATLLGGVSPFFSASPISRSTP